MSATRKGQFKTVRVKGGKEYIEVAERVKFLSQDFEGDYSISTDYNYFESRKMWVVKATLTLYIEEKSFVYTGLAQELESGVGVNSTSALENAETSAVGRACAMAGIGIIDGIASLDEINKAKNRSQQQPAKPIPVATPASEPEAISQDANPITIQQKTQILLLLNNSYIMKEEKEKMVVKINTFDTIRAEKTVEKLKKVIQERSGKPVEDQINATYPEPTQTTAA